MTTDAEIEEKFWKSLKSDRTTLLQLSGTDDGFAQPMTAQLHEDKSDGTIWFFTSKDTDLAQALTGAGHMAQMHFSSKGHDVFACVHGQLFADNDQAMIDALWNPFVAAWFEGGKTDPKIQLLRFEAEDARIWLNENSLFAGIRIMMGRDPKKDYQDKVAQVRLQ